MNAADLHARVRALLEEHNPAHSDPPEFLAARFDAGLAWVHFPVGSGGLDLSRSFQAQVEDELTAAVRRRVAAAPATASGWAWPHRPSRRSVATSSGESFCGPCSLANTSTASCSASRVLAPIWPVWPPVQSRDGDDWIVNGQKVWTSSAQNAQRAILVARTDPTVPKHQGLTYFIARHDRPGRRRAAATADHR